MSSLSEINVKLRNKYQVNKLNAVLEHYYPKGVKVLGTMVAIVLSPLYLLLGVAYAASWIHERIEYGIDFFGDTVDGLIGLLSTLAVIGVFKVKRKVMEEKKNG